MSIHGTPETSCSQGPSRELHDPFVERAGGGGDVVVVLLLFFCQEYKINKTGLREI